MSSDPLLDLIASLQPGMPHPDHSKRVRGRCHDALAGLQRRKGLPAEVGSYESAGADRTPRYGRPWQLAALTGCAYALEAARQVLLVYGGL